MPLLTESQAEILEKLLGKFKERSSVYSYLVVALGVFGVKDQSTLMNVAGGVALVAGAILFLLNDATVRHALTGASQTASAEVIEPIPASLPESIKEPDDTTKPKESTMTSKVTAYFKVIEHAADAVLTAETSSPTGASGSDKLDIAKAALESAYPELGIADVAFETVWPLVKPFIDALVAKFKSTKVVETTASVADTAVATNPS